MSVWISHIVISYLNLNRWARKGKYIEILCMDWLCTIMIRSYIGCWYPVRRKWNQEVWWWRWRGLGTVCWGSTITLIIRWRGGQWGEPDQSSSLDLTLHPLQTCSHLHVRTDWRPAGLSVRRARQDPNTRNAHRHHWLVRDGLNMFLLLKVWTQS